MHVRTTAISKPKKRIIRINEVKKNSDIEVEITFNDHDNNKAIQAHIYIAKQRIYTYTATTHSDLYQALLLYMAGLAFGTSIQASLD